MSVDCALNWMLNKNCVGLLARRHRKRTTKLPHYWLNELFHLWQSCLVNTLRRAFLYWHLALYVVAFKKFLKKSNELVNR